MFWFRFWPNGITFFVILFLLIGFGGCGWRPLYGQGQSGHKIIFLLSEIEIETSKNSAGKSLHRDLKPLFYHKKSAGKESAGKKMRLIIRVKTQEQDVLVRSDDRATRRNLIATASYRLVHQKRGGSQNKTKKKAKKKKIFSDQVHAIISYNRSASEFANTISRRDAQKRVLDQLARAIKQRIVAFLQTQTEDDDGEDQAQ